MPLVYQQPARSLGVGESDRALVRALQRDLRSLGYLRSGIDGDFGAGTAQAVRSLTWDLLHNKGASTGNDGPAPVAIADYNRGRVAAVVAVIDERVAACIADLLADPRVPKLPSSADPAAANREALAAIRAMVGHKAPPPFIAAMIRQESSAMHFRVPGGNDHDDFVVVGLDRNVAGNQDIVTSRGYGVGQYTLFHHPPRPEEVEDFIVDPVRNVAHAFGELRLKFDKWIAGPIDRADDRSREHPLLKEPRLCRYAPADPRYMRDCRACAAAARKVDIERGTPAYEGASIRYDVTQYYRSATYGGVPDRSDFLCDWPYAARRYNGGGINSFHYQTRILLNLLSEPPASWS
ncbi:MAG: peptidoglycan-binding protein [Enhydrobacter sp.]|nr:MAG: peptidoglycan-binding protein [Enhydrobacter sp.]